MAVGAAGVMIVLIGIGVLVGGMGVVFCRQDAKLMPIINMLNNFFQDISKNLCKYVSC